MSMNVTEILAYLGVECQPPTLDFLNALLFAWAKNIPWESASRMARHSQSSSAAPEDFAWLPDTFFPKAVELGTGGTCFESNLAQKALLDELGFESTFAFCDMNPDWENPHCSLIVTLDGERYMADAGFPVPAAMRLDPQQTTTADVPVYRYHAIPTSDERWRIERTSGAHHEQIFTIKGAPIERANFMARLLRDHEVDGYFLNEVIISQMAEANDHILRYSDGKGLVRRIVGAEESIPLSAEEQADLPTTLAGLFDMDEQILAAALAHKDSLA